MNVEIKIELTDEEWMSLLDPERDGLPRCCGNISALRDEIFNVVRNSCAVPFYRVQSFLRAYLWCFESHDLPNSSVHKILDQILTDSDNASLFERLKKLDHGDDQLRQDGENV